MTRATHSSAGTAGDPCTESSLQSAAACLCTVPSNKGLKAQQMIPNDYIYMVLTETILINLVYCLIIHMILFLYVA